MDTCAAGVRGALLDPQAGRPPGKHSGLTVVNAGNAHTFAALVREGMCGIYEHHTGLLSPEKFFSLIWKDFNRAN